MNPLRIISGHSTAGTLSVGDNAVTLAEVMGSDVQPEHVPARKVNPVSRRLADTSLAKQELGFKAEIPLEEGLARLVAWWRAEHAASES